MKIDWEQLKDAFCFSTEGSEWYLDLETGGTIFIGELDPDAGDVTPDDIEDEPDRYLLIEPPSSRGAYEWMVEFTEGVEDENFAEKLRIALDGKGAFRRFKDVLMGYPEQREAWFKFEDSKINEAIEEWMKSSGIEADNFPPWREKEED